MPRAQYVALLSLAALSLSAMAGQANAQELLTAQPSAEYRTPRPLLIPRKLPGSQTVPIALPPVNPAISDEKRRAAIDELYPALPKLPPAVEMQPGPSGQPLTLAELEQLACSQSPQLRQAQADVQAARGVALQAGAYPNPQFAYEADTVGTGNTAGYQGVNLAQTLATGGKLHLARAASEVDVCNAQLTLRHTQSDVLTQVRVRYYAVLAALERLSVAQALQEFTQDIFRIQVERVKAGEAAAYEPLQVRVLASQAQLTVLQARNDYLSAWRQLAATLSTPEMPPTRVAGDVEEVVPQVRYEALLGKIWREHTDLQVATNSITRAQYQLRLARVTPWVPDLNAVAVVQKDYTAPPYNTTVNVLLGAKVPLWDQNRGAILSAEAALCRARQECGRVRDELAANLASTYARYETNRVAVEYHRTGIVPDQIRTYRGIYHRYEVDPRSVSFGDLVSAQQSLAVVINTYVQAMADQWLAVVELAGLLQAESLSELNEGASTAEPTAAPH